MKDFLQKIKEKNITIYILLLVLSFLSVYPVFQRPNIWGHDSQFHIALIDDISENISIKNLFPKITSRVGNGIGYGTQLFYAPFPHYFGAYVHLILKNFGIKANETLSFLYLLVTYFSSILIYHLAVRKTNHKGIALLSCLIFLLMPYRISDIVTRSSYSEVFVFFFFPLILLALDNFINEKPFLHLFVIGFTGMILSHIPIAIFGCLLIGIWGIFHIKEIWNLEKIEKLVFGIVIVVIMILPFLSLMLSQAMCGNYLVFKGNYLSDLGLIEAFRVPLAGLIIPTDPMFPIDFTKFGLEEGKYDWSVMQFINILVMLSFFTTFMIHCISTLKHKKIDKDNLFLFIASIVCLVLCVNYPIWTKLPSFFVYLQFPWRLEVFLTILFSIYAPLWLTTIPFAKKKQSALIGIMMVGLILTSIPMYRAITRYTFTYDEYDINYGMGHSKEYLPVKTPKNYYEKIDSSKPLVDGKYSPKAQINVIDANTLTVEIDFLPESTIELPRLFYIGYQLKDENGKKIYFYENENGMIAFRARAGIYTLTYAAPRFYHLFSAIRWITIIVVIVNAIKKKISNQ